MKNFIVASVLGKQQRQREQNQLEQQVSHHKNGGVNNKRMSQQPVTKTRTSLVKERPRGKSCDRLLENRSESHHYGEWNDDGGFGQWRAIHHGPTSLPRPETYFHHARPISVSITDRIQLVLEQERQQKQQQVESALEQASNHRFHQPLFSSSQYYPEYHPYPSVTTNSSANTMMTMSSWAYQSGSSSEEAVGPQSLDSQWAMQRNNHRVNHPSYPAAVAGASAMAQPPASTLSRKLSTYGTLPRNRQRFFMAKYQSK